jgi:hypothetical protein
MTSNVRRLIVVRRRGPTEVRKGTKERRGPSGASGNEGRQRGSTGANKSKSEGFEFKMAEKSKEKFGVNDRHKGEKNKKIPYGPPLHFSP